MVNNINNTKAVNAKVDSVVKDTAKVDNADKVTVKVVIAKADNVDKDIAKVDTVSMVNKVSREIVAAVVVVDVDLKAKI